ncbi:low molecular weight phosphotyrosine protein phosphatase [Aquabacterium sp. A7-Y]|uniref:low molecular weight protein-tyrosine-phosphatase n=1 Tax=Aquabacterium sp. A7-Y TaxID=1349605 RepID=UPI00223E89CC|nr:low molecular weight protein-tyrosine-phosphatase [Aquabacterium sp. A7-Y]MCW7537549.1 low molecular weight phosphotyrosine protein phosphatase [Aquabacterium sp. A7-Y]
MPAAAPTQHILFVCFGNICRSPSAEGVFRRLVERAGMASRLLVDSAGTHDYRVGEPPDPRAQAHASRRGYDLCALRARQVLPLDFERFDLILAMDRENLAALQAACPPEHRHKLRRLMEFARRHREEEVPDPYYGSAAGFEVVLDYLEDACAGLLEHLQQVEAARSQSFPCLKLD